MPKASDTTVEAGTVVDISPEPEIALDESVASGGGEPEVTEPGFPDQAETVPEAAEAEKPARKRKTTATHSPATTQKTARKATKTTRKKTTRTTKKTATKAAKTTHRTAKKMPVVADEPVGG